MKEAQKQCCLVPPSLGRRPFRPSLQRGALLLLLLFQLSIGLPARLLACLPLLPALPALAAVSRNLANRTLLSLPPPPSLPPRYAAAAAAAAGLLECRSNGNWSMMNC
jgi:hypothetical protein